MFRLKIRIIKYHWHVNIKLWNNWRRNLLVKCAAKWSKKHANTMLIFRCTWIKLLTPIYISSSVFTFIHFNYANNTELSTPRNLTQFKNFPTLPYNIYIYTGRYERVTPNFGVYTTPKYRRHCVLKYLIMLSHASNPYNINPFITFVLPLDQPLSLRRSLYVQPTPWSSTWLPW